MGGTSIETQLVLDTELMSPLSLELSCRWMGTASMVVNPAFTFTLASYEARDAHIIVRGESDKVMRGDAWSASFPIHLSRS